MTDWMKRNKWWTLAVVPAAALMMASASFRYVEVYRPNHFTAEIGKGNTAEFDIPVSLDGFDYHRVGKVEAFAAQRLKSDDMNAFNPPQESEMIAVATKWNAEPDALISGCKMWLRAKDGKEYDYLGDLLNPKKPDNNFSERFACVPPKTPGSLPPSIFVPNPESDPDNPRPAEWKKVAIFVVPAGVEPDSIRIGWEEPHYLSLKLPELSQDIVPQSAIDKDKQSR